MFVLSHCMFDILYCLPVKRDRATGWAKTISRAGRQLYSSRTLLGPTMAVVLLAGMTRSRPFRNQDVRSGRIGKCDIAKRRYLRGILAAYGPSVERASILGFRSIVLNRSVLRCSRGLGYHDDLRCDLGQTLRSEEDSKDDPEQGASGQQQSPVFIRGAKKEREKTYITISPGSVISPRLYIRMPCQNASY